MVVYPPLDFGVVAQLPFRTARCRAVRQIANYLSYSLASLFRLANPVFGVVCKDGQTIKIFRHNPNLANINSG